MNKNRHRIIFNVARGQRVVVAECASNAGKGSATTTLSIGLALALGVVFHSSAHAQIVTDPGAPGHQRPTVLQAGNGVPVINIQTPSAAGVSRNSYSQFDIGAPGAILNNSRAHVQTQLGGFVTGNPWIGTPARVILNEVNSSHPSYLRGPLEVAGQRAEVIIANPSGIRVNGGTFLNASGVTLATGTPVMNSGQLESFRVAQGSVAIEGLGLDTRTADHTRILARAAEVNAGLWSSHLKVVTGVNDVSADASTVTANAATPQGPAPQFSLDVAAVGGMYADHIFLVGTEAGLGVNNGGVMSANAGNLLLDSDGWLRNRGTVQASGNLTVNARGEVKNEKDLYTGGALSVATSQALTNSGNLNAQSRVQVQAAATENRSGARIASNAAIQVHTSGAQTNQGEIVSAGDITLQAAELRNEGRLLSSNGNLSITSRSDVSNTGPNARIYAAGTQHIDAAGNLTNSGLIASHGNLAAAANRVNSTGALAAGLNTDGSLKTEAARLDVKATQHLTAQGSNLASGHLHLEAQALDISDSQTRAKTLQLVATGRETDANPGTGLIDASHADVLVHGPIGIDSKALKTDSGQLQALGNIDIRADELSNRAGLIRSSAALTVVTQNIDNRDARSATGADPSLTPMGLIAQSVQLATANLLNQGGAVIATEQLTVVGASAGGQNQIQNAHGLLSAGTTLDIRASADSRFAITNTGGTLIANELLTAAAQTFSLDGEVLSQQDMRLSVRGNHSQTAGSRIVANRDLALDIEGGGLVNDGAVFAGHHLGLSATSLDNTATGEIGAGTTTDIQLTQDLINRGLIDGRTTQLHARNLSNIGSGRIHGDVLTIQATSLVNDSETLSGLRPDAVIAARNHLNIAVQTLQNRGAVLSSAGDMVVTSQGDMHNTGAAAQIYAAGDQQVHAHGALTNSGLIAARENLTMKADSVHSTGALAAGLNADGSLKADAALLDVRATRQVTAEGHNQSSGELHLEGEALDIANSQTRAKTMSLTATGTVAAPGSGRIDASGADLLAQGSIDIDGRTLKTSGAQLQALGDIQIAVDRINNHAGLIRSGGRLTVTADEIDNRDTRTANGANPLGLVAQSVALTTNDLLNQGGAIIAGNALTIASAGRIENAQGLLSAGGTLDIREATAPAALLASSPVARALSINNMGGTLIADQQLMVTAGTLSLDGAVLSQGDMILSVQGDHSHAAGSRIVANRDLTLDIEDGGLQNSGELLAGRNLSFAATSLTNTATGEISAGNTTDIQVTDALTNQGLIDGKNTSIQASDLNNIGTGRIYGDVLAIQTDALLNDTGMVNGVRSDAIIAARNRMDIGARILVNREGASILSLGNIAIGGELDANAQAKGMAEKIQNQSATIEALGHLSIATQTLENTNTHFVADLVTGAATPYLKVIHNGVVYDPQVLGTNFGPLNTYVDNASFRLLLPSADYPFSEFPANDMSWARRDANIFAGMGVQGGLFGVFGPEVVSPFAVDYSRRRIRECRDCAWEDVENYSLGHVIWAKFGVTPYDPDAGDDAKRAALDQLDLKIAAYNLSVGSRTLRDWTVIDATAQEFTPIVKSSLPARLLAGGNLSIHSTQEVVNDKSEIVAGGALSITGATLRNLDAEVLSRNEVQGQSVYSYYVEDCGLCDADRRYLFTPYEVQTTRTVGLPVSRVDAHTAPAASSLQIGALTAPQTRATGSATGAPATGETESLTVLPSSALFPAANGASQTGSTSSAAGTPVAGAPASLSAQPSIALPTSALFRSPASSTATYLIETDPRFTDQRQWLSSDYMLQAMSIDPATTQKRLGDGFYEQRLIREQIAALTGQRFLGDHTSDDAQYQALMTHGATFAQAFQLRPGIALTAEQVALLTSDIVWLIERPVLMPDGSTVMALVPQVYLMPREGDLLPNGSLLAGAQVNLDLSGDLTHAGTIAGRNMVQITAQNIQQIGGLTTGASVNLNARDNLDVIGGRIVARDRLNLQAGGDIGIRSTTQSTGDGATSSSRTTLDRISALYVTNPGGTLLVMAGGNLTAQGAALHSEGSVSLQAQGDIALSTVSTQARDEARWNELNHLSLTERNETGSTVTAAGQIGLQAGGDITARAANLQAGGALDLQAGGSVRIEAGERAKAHEEAHHVEGGGWLSSTTTITRNAADETQAIASNLGGQTVSIRSGQDVGIVGSNVIGDAGVSVTAAGDVSIVAAQTRFEQSDYRKEESDGISFEDASVSWGNQSQSKDQRSQGTGSAASTVGAITGNVNISAGQTYTQIGSDVMSPGGDISIAAQEVQIVEAREARRSETEEKFEKSGITVALSTPLITAMQSVVGQMEAAGDTRDGRMQGLAAANSAFTVNNALNQAAEGASKANATDAQKAGGVNVSISFGSSSSESRTLETSDTARGSSVNAGGSVSITASGKGTESDILIRGSDIIAGADASLSAEGDVNLLAAQNTASLSGSNKSDSGSVGISFGTSGFGVTASASSARGKEAGDELTHTNTRITAGNKVSIQSGNDTTLQGALVKADTIQADIGGNLKIESLQDTSTYDSKQSSVSASVTIGVGASGSFNASKSNISSDFASVAEQSGLKAGDGGFQVNVKGDTTLIGGAIASNQSAVDNHLNSFSTGGELTTIDIENKAEYSASSTSVGVGGGTDGKNKGISGVGVGIGSDSGNASSVTKAGISGIAGDTSIRSTDAEAGIQSIFDKETVQKEINAQTKITEAFTREAPKAVASYALNQQRDLKAQLDAETDPVKQDALKAEIEKWDEGGVYRVALHAVVGGLGGGFSGAVGAAASGASANLMNALQDDIQQGLAALGFGEVVAKGIAQGVATLTAAGVGAVVGGAQGAATAATVDANNRQLHPREKKLAQELAKKSNDKYTVEQIEEQMRLMGNKALNKAANTTEVLTTTQEIASNLNQDPSMPKAVDGTSVVEIPGRANTELQQYIIGNSTSGADYIPGQSPYVASNATLNRPSTTNGPSGTTSNTAKCANGDLACISGVGQQQNAPITQQTKEGIADAADVTSRGAGVIAAGATAVAAQGGPYTKPAQIVAIGATALGAGADVVEQIVRPDAGKTTHTSISIYFQEWADSRAPGIAPITNEVVEFWKRSESGQTLEVWMNTQWKNFLERTK